VATTFSLRVLINSFTFVSKKMKINKTELIKAKITPEMKRDLERLASLRDESEALLVREALGFYIKIVHSAMKDLGPRFRGEVSESF